MLEGERISVSDWKVLVCSGSRHQQLGRPNPSLEFSTQRNPEISQRFQLFTDMAFQDALHSPGVDCRGRAR